MDFDNPLFNDSLAKAVEAKLGSTVKVFDSCSGKFVSWTPGCGSAGILTFPVSRGGCGG